MRSQLRQNISSKVETMKILLMGRKHVSANILKALVDWDEVSVVAVVTDSHIPNSPTAAAARDLGIQLLDLEDVTEQIKMGRMEFDLGISVVYWRKIPVEILNVPKLGIINFHPAPLPAYKGTAGYNLAILNSLSEWSISAHYIDSSIDTGPIIDDLTFPIRSQKLTAQDLEKETMERMFRFVLDTTHRALSSKTLLQTRENCGGTYISRPAMESMKKISEGDNVEAKVRAFWFPPYRGAYVEIEGEKYTLVSDEILQSLATSDNTNNFEHLKYKKVMKIDE